MGAGLFKSMDIDICMTDQSKWERVCKSGCIDICMTDQSKWERVYLKQDVLTSV